MKNLNVLQIAQIICTCLVIGAWVGCAAKGGNSNTDGVKSTQTTSVDTSSTEEENEATSESTTNASTGEITVCEPRAEEELAYSGPEGTLGVGVCKAGKQRCNADGTAWEMTEAEIVPQTEDCSNQIDDNCDGVVACDGLGEWVMQFEEKQGEEPGLVTLYGGLQVDSQERVWLTGGFGGSLQLGKKEWIGQWVNDFFAMRVDGKDAIGWSWASGSAAESEYGYSVAVDDTGQVALGIRLFNIDDGNGGASVDLGPDKDSPIHVGPDQTVNHAMVVGMIDGEGQYQWSKLWSAFGENQFIYVMDMAFDNLGNLWVAGIFNGGNVNVGTVEKPEILQHHGQSDYYIVKLSPRGEVLWTKSFGDGGNQFNGLRMVLDQENGVWLAGTLTGQLSFGNGVMLDGGVGDEGDMFVVKLDSEGNGVWGEQWGDEELQRFLDVAVDSDGNGILVGGYQGQLDGLAPKPLINANTEKNTYTDGVIVKLNGQNGQVMWVEDVKQKGEGYLKGVEVDRVGQAVIVGMVSGTGTMEINGVWVEGTGNDEDRDIVVVKLAGATKNTVWRPRVYNNSSFTDHFDVAVGSLGEIYVAGDFSGETDFGAAGKLNSGPDDGSDGFLLKLRP